MPGLDFHSVERASDLLPVLRPAREYLGLTGLAKAVAKLMTPSRLFYCMTSGKEIVGHGWLMLSHCRDYRVEKGDVVIGPVNTAKAWQGRGIATFGLASAIDAMVARGHSVFFIDTRDENIAMRKAIARCGFGEPWSELAE